METMIDIQALTLHFQAVSTVVPLHPIDTEADYELAVARLNELLDAGAADENHPLADLVVALGEFIADYDDAHYPIPDLSGAQMLRYLMDQDGLVQSDLAEIGSQGVVSEILNGKRELNVKQIKKLSERFKVNPVVFL